MKNKFTNFLNFIKKHYRGIVAALLICLLVFYVCDGIINEIMGWKYNVSDFEIKDFGKNKAYFETLADNLYDIFQGEYDGDDTLSQLVFFDAGDGWRVKYWYEDSSRDCEKTIEQTSEEAECLRYVLQSFSEAYITGELFSIHVHLNRVTFFGYTPYSVVYSRNGKKPEFLISLEEKSEIYCQRLARRWYQCVYKNRG